MDKKLLLFLFILVLCISTVFVGCNKKIEVEFPDTPEEYDEEFWEESYAAYAVMKDVVEKNRDFTKDENKYFEYYTNKDIELLKTIEEKELFGYILDAHINMLQSKYYKISKIEQSDEKSLEHKEKAKEYLKELDEFYKNLEK